MANTLPTKCPACSSEMHVSVLRCPACLTEVQGDFTLARLAALGAEQMSFLLTFIRLRGNLKDVGAEIGISYPTARNRLDNLIAALGFEDADSASLRRLDILTRLRNGEISAEDALTLLEGGTTHE
ncbi:DUF2089 domain-containing protein [Oscillospiraceae bacterium OttesenSCG-928-G22]|nr:DUF2089 domain-containing protein [Oscillospiraceae bacterium OttesenSCG-928-G22]